jgi:type I restriction enzyme S subunit
MALPEGWVEVTLDDVCNKITDGTHKTPKYQSSGVRFISIKNIKPFKKINWDSYEKYISLAEHEALTKRCNPEIGDILFPRIGTLGYAKRIDFEETVSLFVGLGLLKPIHKLISSQYLEYWMNSPEINRLSHQRATGSGRLTLALSESKKLPVPLTSIPMQNRVVSKVEELFSHIDSGVEGLKQAKVKLQQYRQSLLKDAVTGKLTEKWREQNADKLEPANELLERILEERRANWEAEQLKMFEEKGKTPKDDKWKEKYKVVEPLTEKVISGLPPLPESWNYAKLGQLIEDPKYGTSKKCTYESKGKGVLRIPNIAAGEINSEDMKFANFSDTEIETYKLNEGDILTIRSNGSVSLVGKCAVISEKDSEFLFAGYLIRLRPILKHIDPHYLKSVLASGFLRKQIETLAKSSSGVNNINTGELQSLIIPICGLKEQQVNAENIDSKNIIIDRQFEQYEKLLIEFSKNKSAILSKAFAGELVENIETEETAIQLLEKIQAEKLLLEEKAKLAQQKPTTRTKKMDKQPIIDVLKKAAGAGENTKALTVDELFEQAGFQNDVSPEGIEAFYQELKTVAENENVTVTPVMLKEKKQGDKFKYKEVEENEAG